MDRASVCHNGHGSCTVIVVWWLWRQRLRAEREKLATLSAQVQADLSRAMKSVSGSGPAASSPPAKVKSSERHDGRGDSSTDESLRSRLMFMNFTGSSGERY